ncbi:uncharacterized protein JN550_004191 [Neoarthrinium moseri]|uniref:uncharacterized protein n=1 Tax=Neoarthrinium moseri TaxID=1658444 RepID=UPI001FDC9910|nr:uncharacterized protein JN550_004191 [Neoarthrinium moseri]KAI1871988.1 hypothetical protein JN550_004191 [Neoarthrinium moseri]
MPARLRGLFALIAQEITTAGHSPCAEDQTILLTKEGRKPAQSVLRTYPRPWHRRGRSIVLVHPSWGARGLSGLDGIDVNALEMAAVPWRPVWRILSWGTHIHPKPQRQPAARYRLAPCSFTADTPRLQYPPASCPARQTGQTSRTAAPRAVRASPGWDEAVDPKACVRPQGYHLRHLELQPCPKVKALNALEPFLALTKSATSTRAAADLVTRATSAQGTYVFAELLQAPQIQALAQSPEHAPYFTQLEIFSYGTYADYTAATSLPALNEQQTLKLRQLSLLTLAKDPHNLSYSSLQSALGLSDSRAVEELVISAIYADLISAQLDPRNQAVHVSSVSPLRDLAPGSIPSVLASLQAWSSRCTSTLADLESQIAAIKAAAAARHSEKNAWAEVTEKLVAEEMSSEGKGKEGAHSRNQTNLISRATAALNRQRYGKRDRGASSQEHDPADEEVMDVDDEDETEAAADSSGGVAGKKRASRRKL